jgi:tRNA A58 N-methylase Trm61
MRCPWLIPLLVACGSGETVSPRDDFASQQLRHDIAVPPGPLLAALGLHPGSKVAEIGAGTGLVTIHLARAVAPDGLVVVTDIDKRVLDILDQRIAAAGLDDLVEQRLVAAAAPGLEAGTYDLIIPEGFDDPGEDPTEASTYDAILLQDVVHFLPDPAGWLRTARNALRPNGRIVITASNRHRERALAAARAAGLHLIASADLSPGDFIATWSRD